MLADQSLTIPFTVGSATTAAANGGSTLTNYACASDNNTLVPSNNIVINNVGAINPTVTITPAMGQVGMAQITVTLTDDNLNLTKSTMGTFSVMVTPNTNVVFADYFDYDASQQSLDQIVGDAWTHLSGIDTQMQVYGNGNGDFVTVDSVNNTENLQAALIGGPYSDSGPGSLYSSFIVNLPGAAMPAGDYAGFFLVFNDDSGTTGDYECGVYALTNDVVENDGSHYRLAIENWPGNGSEDDSHIKIFPQDLVAGSNYVVVTELVLTNGFSTLWVNPIYGPSSTSVTDTTTASAAGATLFSIGAIELRESSSENTDENPGVVDVGCLKVGTTFDSVFPSLQVQPSGNNVILNWSDPTLGIQSATDILGPWTPVTGATPPYTNAVDSNPQMFFMLGQ
jgi:hypothetical protein